MYDFPWKSSRLQRDVEYQNLHKLTTWMQFFLFASYPALVACQDTVYVACILNLDKDGPTVIDVPGGAGPGTVNLLADSIKLK